MICGQHKVGFVDIRIDLCKLNNNAIYNIVEKEYLACSKNQAYRVSSG